MRLTLFLLAVAWSLASVLSVAAEPAAPVPAAALLPASPGAACGSAPAQQDDWKPQWDKRLTSSDAPCAVADNNLALAEAEILKPGSPPAMAPGQKWDRKLRPQHLDAIQTRFDLQPAELDMIGRIGFAVPARLEFPAYSRAYHEIFQSQLPVYITADSIFHAIFASHGSVAESLERHRLSPLLAHALYAMHCALPGAASAYPHDVARDLDLYLLVARRLIGDPSEAKSAFADKAVEEQAAELVAKAMAADGLATVTLFGREQLIDFTQYGPRGHYANEEALQKYFRAAMWASRLEFNLVSRSSRSSAPGPDPEPSETPREALAALALADLAMKSGAAKNIEDLDTAWASLAGRREDVSIAQLAGLGTEVGSLTDSQAFDRLKSGIGNRFQRTVRLHPMPAGSRELSAITTLIGPRIVTDAGAVMPLVNSAVPGRERLTVADLAYSFGLDHAKRYLAEDLAKFPKLDAQLGVARALAASAPGGDDLYSAWLAAIRSLTREPAGTLPSFMATDAGKDLRLNTIAAAYGQLKHNNVLVAAQPYAEFGCEIPDGYVEPVPDAYDALIEYAARGVRLATLFDPKDGLGIRTYFERTGQVLRVLRAIAGDELAGRQLTEAQRRWLGMVAEMTLDRSVPMTGYPPMYTGWYFDLFFARENDGMRGADCIADYFTSQKGVAYVGAAAPRLGIFVVDAGGPPRTFAGPVARAYEVFGPLAARYTDETAKLLAGREEPWAGAYTIAAPPQPSSVQLRYDAEARELVIASDQALGQATIKVLDHHRRTIETKRTELKQGENRIAIEHDHVGGVFFESNGFRDFVVADAYGEINGQWGKPPIEQQ